jgi:sec-independent protein translocase protein TatC
MNSEHHEPQSLYAHLAELRNRLVYSILAWLVAASISYLMIADIMQWLTAPLAAAYASPESKRLIFTSLPEAFVTYIHLAMISGFFFAFPVIVWQLYRFIAPALYVRERRATLPFLIAAPCLFYMGGLLAYFYIFPAAWKFFVSFEILTNPMQGGLAVELEAKLSEYLSLISGIIIAFGISFQLPLVLLLLIKAKVVDVATLKRSRRYAIVGLLIVSAVLTPPDIISQIGLFVPLYALYESAIFAGKFVSKENISKEN